MSTATLPRSRPVRVAVSRLVRTGRWWIQLAGHVVFVGLPIAWAVGRSERR